MKRTIKSFALALLLFLSGKTIAQEKPNIILIMTDDQGWYDVGFNGNKELKTPYLDKLASKGLIFNRFYSGSAVCSPTRASLITGRNPLRTNVPYANSGHIRQGEITLPELLKEHGYKTGHFGKWHLGTLSKTIKDANRGGNPKFIEEFTLPTEHGYEEYFATESKVPTYNPMEKPNKFNEGESLRFGWTARNSSDSVKNYGTQYWTAENSPVKDNLKGDDSRVIVDRVIPFIENANEQPFFTTIWFHTPHLPVVADSLHRAIYSNLSFEKQLYYGAITAMDEQIGRLWEHLEQEGIADNTILFFCSDNGPERNTPGSAHNFKGQKRSLYEGGVRVPAFVVWPNKVKAGKRTDFPAVTSDYLPTLLDILNIKYPDSRPIDGVSLLKTFSGKQTKRKQPIGFICEPYVSWISNKHKLIKVNEFELYNLINDPQEQNNIIKTKARKANKLKKDLVKWQESVERSNKGLDYSSKL